jgi:DNA-binding MurR/RpiR family transcriptional regulator
MVKAQLARKPQDKVMRLLNELRERPNEESIRRILNAVEDARRARFDYIGLDRAVKRILARALTEKESALVKRLL